MSRIRQTSPPRWLGYLVAVGTTALALGVRFLLDPFLQGHLPYVTFFVAVAATVWFTSIGPSLFAVFLGGMASDYFFITPRYSFAMPDMQQQVGFATYCMVTLAFVGFGQALRRARVRSEAERQRLMITLSSIGDGVITTSATGKIESINPVAEALTGWKEEEALGKDLTVVFRIINAQTRQPVESPVAKVIREGVVVGLANHTLLLSKDGRETPIADSGAPIREPGMGKIHGVVLVFRDQTEEQKAAAALAASEEIHRLTTETAAEGIITMDEQSIIIAANPAAEKIFGYGAGELIGQSMTLLIPERLRVAHRAGVERFVKTGQRNISWNSVELPGLCKDGKEIPLEISFGTHFRNERRLFTGTMRDITERKKAEEKLRASEERFRALAENLPQLAWMADETGSIFWYNQRWYDYTGTDMQAMQGGGWESVHHPEYLARVVQKWRQALAEGKPWEDVFPLRQKSGEFGWFLSRAFPIRDAEGKITRWFGTNTDITELRAAQDSLKNAQRELEEHAGQLEKTVSERTASLREIISELEGYSYSISHDMRAPLRAMQAYAHLLTEELSGKLEQNHQRYLQRIVTSATRLDRLITDILSYSRVSQAQIELRPVNLDTLVEDLIHQYPALHNARIEMEEKLGSVMAAEALLSQVLANLLTNAVKFVRSGETPRIKMWTDREVKSSTPAAPEDSSRSGYVRLLVQDNGIGIAEEDQQRIFSIFTRVHSDKEYEGTGIGLSVVKRAVERMGGRIGLRSALGHGSTFWIDLPKAESRVESHG